ncbi:galactose oxidase/kelch repeat superfamily protein [Striga asiatica]|uniref:Galactose oxidase/kelch repeat superfamily protein n=1 Tax=Striga asiatica TaxID=4170 RepID=A0A5A7RF62_STRAF|nr:galactose oxidase/kelch repeat superfamily protein [Striga asiatica]
MNTVCTLYEAITRKTGSHNQIPATGARKTRLNSHWKGLTNWARFFLHNQIAALYCSFRIFRVEALQSYFSISKRAARPINSLSSRSFISGLSLLRQSLRSPGLYRYPVFPCCSSGKMSVMPPALAATTGSPDDMASSTTRPSVSDSEGMTKMSPLAYACDSSSPWSVPVNTAGMFENICSSSSLMGKKGLGVPFKKIQTLLDSEPSYVND